MSEQFDDVVDVVMDDVYDILNDNFDKWMKAARVDLRNMGVNAFREPVGEGEGYKKAIALVLVQYYRNVHLGEGAKRRHA